MTQFMLSIFSIALCFSATAQQAETILGTWLTSSKEAKVEITQKGDSYFGKIIWLKEPNNPDGTPKTDKKNDDESMHKTPILGYQILKNFKFKAKDHSWEDGTIYDPKSGNTYDCIIEAPENDVLEVRGYIGLSLFGRTDTWTRASS